MAKLSRSRGARREIRREIYGPEKRLIDAQIPTAGERTIARNELCVLPELLPSTDRAARIPRNCALRHSQCIRSRRPAFLRPGDQLHNQTAASHSRSRSVCFPLISRSVLQNENDRRPRRKGMEKEKKRRRDQFFRFDRFRLCQ